MQKHLKVNLKAIGLLDLLDLTFRKVELSISELGKK